MADVTNRARIVPIMAVRQPSNPPKEAPPTTTTNEEQSPAAKEACNKSEEAKDDELKLACLQEKGLYALPTKGDGNCLYYALSDQVYGDFTHAQEIRTRLANHIAAHKNYFMHFTAGVGGERRAPRRAAAAAARNACSSSFSSSCSSSRASPVPGKDQEQNFETRLSESRKNGTWGGAEEIQAFCQSFQKDVRVYMDSGIQEFRDVNAPHGEVREEVHIAFHSFNHYSSVRNRDGPHTGLPCILVGSKAAADGKTDNEEEKAASPGTAVVDVATPWKISTIQESLGGRYDRATIIEMLKQCRGDIDRAFANLLDEGNITPTSSQPSTDSSSSVEDDFKTDAAMLPVPPKVILKPLLQPSSRSSSPFSTASKRSAEDSDAEEDIQTVPRRIRAREQKKRILPDVTVGIAFRDERNDLVSLRLRVSPDVVAERATTKEPVTKTISAAKDDSSAEPEPGRRASLDQETPATQRKLRRSQRNVNKGSVQKEL